MSECNTTEAMELVRELNESGHPVKTVLFLSTRLYLVFVATDRTETDWVEVRGTDLHKTVRTASRLLVEKLSANETTH